MQQTVRLLGDLGERYGSEHTYHDLRSPAEAVKLLCINSPEFQKELAYAHEHGIAYTLVQAGEFLDYEDLHLPLGQNDLVLTPVVAGSGGTAGRIILGVGLIAASFLLPGAGVFGAKSVFGVGALTTATGAATFATTLGTALSVIGASLVLSGVAELLAPQPVIPSLNNNNRTRAGENSNGLGPQGVSRATSGQQSYAFAGPANTAGVGATVPLVYGKLLIGSQLLSSKVEVTSESDPTGEFFLPPGAKSITINGEKPGNKFESLNGLRTRRYNNSQVRIENYGDKRRAPNKIVKFDDTSRNGIVDDLDARESNSRRNLQIFIEINKGLSRVIGGQTVPAFVTYEITVKKENYPGDSPVFARVRATIQGLLRKTDNYRFCHAIAYGLSGTEKSDTVVAPAIQIIDTDADEGQQLVVRGVGYKMFYDGSENETEDLTSD